MATHVTDSGRVLRIFAPVVSRVYANAPARAQANAEADSQDKLFATLRWLTRGSRS